MTDRMLRIGVVGFGYWGPNHVRVLSRFPDVQISVIDPASEQRERALKQFPKTTVFPNLSDAPEPFDAVVVCSPPATHRAVTEQAFAMGAHVLVEKPLALTSADAEAMVVMAEAADRVLMVGHIYDFHSATQWLEDNARVGAYGTIRYLDAARLAVGGYRTDVNVMWDMAPHDMCLMRRVMGSWPSAVTAWSIDHSGQGVSDLAYLRLEFPQSEALGYIRVSWLDPAKVRRFTIVGEQRMAVFNDAADPTRPLRVTETGAAPELGEGAPHPVPSAYPDELVTTPVIEPTEPLEAELRHFLTAATTGSKPTLATGHDGLQVVRVLEAAERSAERGERVPVPGVGDAVGATS